MNQSAIASILIDAMCCHDEPTCHDGRIPTPAQCRACGHCEREAAHGGIDPHAPGAKLDSGKPDMALLLDFSLAIREVAKVCTYGAKKYSVGGWQHVEDGIHRYDAALLRHFFTADEPFDAESELLHRAHVAWNALASLELLLREIAE